MAPSSDVAFVIPQLAVFPPAQSGGAVGQVNCTGLEYDFNRVTLLSMQNLQSK